MRLSSFFKRSKPEEGSEAPTADDDIVEVSPSVAPRGGPTRTEIMRAPPMDDTKTKTRSSKEKVALKKAPAKTAAKRTSVSKKSTAASKTASDDVKGKRPPELKGFERTLKEYAVRTRTTFDSTTANAVFTEYMSRVFRDIGYKMLMVRDGDRGTITMLDRAETSDPNDVKNKIVVKCVYMSKGSVGPVSIEEAQEDGAFYRADITWCLTTTDFTDPAVRRSRKDGAKVKLFDGKKLFKEFLSEFDKDD